MARECTQAWGPSVSVFSPASDGSSDESDKSQKSDLWAEISGEIVWYDALAPRPEVL